MESKNEGFVVEWSAGLTIINPERTISVKGCAPEFSGFSMLPISTYSRGITGVTKLGGLPMGVYVALNM